MWTETLSGKRACCFSHLCFYTRGSLAEWMSGRRWQSNHERPFLGICHSTAKWPHSALASLQTCLQYRTLTFGLEGENWSRCWGWWSFQKPRLSTSCLGHTPERWDRHSLGRAPTQCWASHSVPRRCTGRSSEGRSDSATREHKSSTRSIVGLQTSLSNHRYK